MVVEGSCGTLKTANKGRSKIILNVQRYFNGGQNEALNIENCT